MEKVYLGDSVYVDIENDTLKLTTENGYPDDPRNVILLEPEVVENLQAYINRYYAPASGTEATEP
jgi:hypothetical protein